MTFSIAFIKLFLVVRRNTIDNMHLQGPLLIGEEELADNKSDVSFIGQKTMANKKDK